MRHCNCRNALVRASALYVTILLEYIENKLGTPSSPLVQESHESVVGSARVEAYNLHYLNKHNRNSLRAWLVSILKENIRL